MPEVIRLLLAGATFATMSVSAYDNASGMPPWGVTASGARTAPGVAACGPDLEFGTLLISIDGATPLVAYRCLDRGGAIDEGYADLWMASEAEALRWGRRNIRFAIVKGG